MRVAQRTIPHKPICPSWAKVATNSAAAVGVSWVRTGVRRCRASCGRSPMTRQPKRRRRIGQSIAAAASCARAAAGERASPRRVMPIKRVKVTTARVPTTPKSARTMLIPKALTPFITAPACRRPR